MALRRSMLVGTIRGCSYVDIRAYSCLSVCVVVLLSMYIAQIHIIHLLQYFNLRLMMSAQ
jgi:energy-converting hydrogenase Eha subunit C